MRKYLNKGLLYEWFTASKVPILIGLITWGIVAHMILKSDIMLIKNEIAQAESNSFYTVDLGEYFILGVIFLAIYIFASGVSKRNTTMFLCSGPYTKKQIKINELICLLITLGLFILMYVYIAFTIYVRNNELIFIINGFPQVILIEVIRLLLFGIIGILLMLVIDLLFSNSIMAYFGMMALGVSTICIFEKFTTIMNYFRSYERIMNNIFGNIIHNNVDHINILFFRGRFYEDQLGMILKGIIFLVVSIGIMLLIFNISEKRAKLETSSKIFSCKANENMILVYLSLGIGAFINIIITDIFFRHSIYRNGEMTPLLNSDLVKMLATDVISIGVITFISYKIIKKVLKIIG